jgi:hypothetical protein
MAGLSLQKSRRKLNLYFNIEYGKDPLYLLELITSSYPDERLTQSLFEQPRHRQ